MRVVIIGAGIGGLTTALALHRVGITDVVCLESAAEIRPLGVGINLLPHAVRELTELGLADDLEAIAVRTADLTYVNAFGQRIWSEPRGVDAGYGWPQYSIHRGEFQMLLARHVRERLGNAAIRTGVRITSVDSTADGATVRWDGGEATADVVIAADGIHSAVRAQWHREEGAPIWNGTILWRATSRFAPFLGGRSMIMAGHRQTKFVAYPIGPIGDDGLQTINWIAERIEPERGEVQQDWNRAVPVDVFAGHFATWNFDWLDIPALINAAQVVYEYPLVDREPLDTWVQGRVALLGDAAHPTYPVGSNGSSQAILDARALAFALATLPVDDALRFYENERLPKTRGLQMANRMMGPEIVMQLAHERAPQGFDDIEQVIPLTERQEIAARYKSIAGFDPKLLRERTSWTPEGRTHG